MEERRAISRLQNLGYLPPVEVVTQELLTFGLRDFQSTYGIEESEELDVQTQQWLDAPRCGVVDREFSVQSVKRSQEVKIEDGRVTFSRSIVALGEQKAAKPCPWPGLKKTLVLNYAFVEGTSLNFMKPVRDAMDRWEKVRGGGVQVVQFILDPSSPHFTIGWVDSSDSRFDFDFDDIALACLPCKCDSPKPMKFRASNITWISSGLGAGMFNVEAVAIHELGHILGLVHPEKLTGTTMDPRFSDQRGPDEIHPDDAQSLRNLYI